MRNVFFISDHHLGQESFLSYLDDQGNKVRPFGSLEEMHEKIIDCHNSRVGKYDKVYFLGDVAVAVESLNCILPKLNGKKRLILGNHDILPMQEYLKHFQAIYSTKRFDNKFIVSHIPVHSNCFEKTKLNVHGHLHTRKVLLSEGGLDLNYFNVCVEQLNYTPIERSEVKY